MPEFISGDVILAFTVNNERINGLAFPSKKDKYTVNNTVLTCDDGVTATWDNDIWGIKDINNPNGALRVKCAINFNAPTLSEYLKTKVEDVNVGESGLIKQTNDETEQTKNNAITDYRYIGANPNNYVCLEADGVCEDNELYRIIGIIPTQTTQDGIYEERVKLIKNTNYEGDSALNVTSGTNKGYYWSGSASNSSNNWGSSILNTEFLNKEYWNSISTYQKYIGDAVWYLGTGNSAAPKFKKIYKEEKSGSSFIQKHVGLIYPSDYGFATSGGNEATRDQCISEYDVQQNDKDWSQKCINNNWLSLNWKNQSSINIWTITPSNYSDDNKFRVWCWAWTGNIYQGSGVVNEYINEVYPTFYLTKDVLYMIGNGSYDNPYRIFLNE